MIWTGHTEEKSDKNPKLIFINTDKRNGSDKWLQNRTKLYNRRGYRVKVRYNSRKKERR